MALSPRHDFNNHNPSMREIGFERDEAVDGIDKVAIEDRFGHFVEYEVLAS